MDIILLTVAAWLPWRIYPIHLGICAAHMVRHFARLKAFLPPCWHPRSSCGPPLTTECEPRALFGALLSVLLHPRLSPQTCDSYILQTLHPCTVDLRRRCYPDNLCGSLRVDLARLLSLVGMLWCVYRYRARELCIGRVAW